MKLCDENMSNSTDPTSPSIDLKQMWEALFQQRLIVASFLGAVLLVTFIGTRLTTPVYEAVSLIQLMPRAGQEVDVNAVVSFDEAGYLERRDRARTQIQVILSRTVRMATIERYNALGHLDLEGAEGAGELKSMMTVGPREDTQLVEIMVSHSDPERASLLANLITEVYKNQNLSARTSAARDTRVWLEGQTGTFREDLDAATEALITFKEVNDLIDIEEKVDDITKRMGALQTALGEATTELALLESQLDEHRRLMWNGKHDVLAGAFESPALRALSEQHALIMTEAAEVFARYEDKHPKHQEAVARVARVESLLADEVGRMVDGEKSRVRILKRQVERLNEELDIVKVELLAKQRLQDTYANLKMEEDRLRKLYSSLSERGAEVELQARTQLNDVRIVDAALAPGRPARPSLPLNMAIALLVGLGGGLGLALLRHRLDDTIRSTEVLEDALGVPLLGSLPRLPRSLSEEERALRAHEHPQSPTAEALRGIRAMLHVSAAAPTPKTLVIRAHQQLVITSCQPGEGKTDTAVGLALTFAKLGVATLLVDADLRRPRVHTLLGVERGPGLAEALAEIEDVLEVVEPTAIPDLYVLPCGEPVDSPNELLASPALATVLARLRGRYPVVIIDTPPILPVSDALVLGRGAEVLLLVRHGQVRQRDTVQVLERLQHAGALVKGVIFNDVPGTAGGYDYYRLPPSAG
ncbi:MAG: succinoglycan biosynthesis transport protein ExoP [Myxococcota bacterium]|jgi:succinoglycan biosynthesis transport protein ExoP